MEQEVKLKREQEIKAIDTMECALCGRHLSFYCYGEGGSSWCVECLDCDYIYEER